MNKIFADGVEIEVKNRDYNKDGNVGGVEQISHNRSTDIPITETTELKDAIKEQNKDIVVDRLSSIDFASRIERIEMSSIVAYDTCIGINVIPVEFGILTRQKMRKSVSDSGQGRKEFIEVVAGKREQDQKMTIGGKFSNFLGMGQSQNDRR